ncbi:MAG: class I SAM-dependent methyltransferase [Deltaproteobacteria bacterium]|nr:class I SAM-dependent methyltransferase [Deltaproteobacteria bacterium]
MPTLETGLFWPTQDSEPGDRKRQAPEWVAYSFASREAGSRRVLDCACGAGYGSWLLSRGGARSVVGVDLEPDSIAWAKDHFAGPEVQFRVGDATSLPLSSGDVDLAVSLETLEHLRDAPAFVEELHRVLAPGGLLVLSTPLGRGDQRLHPRDPRHVRELDPEELTALLSPRFDIEQRLGMWTAPELGEPRLRLRPGGLEGILRTGAQRVLPDVVRKVGRTLLDANKGPLAWIGADQWTTAPVQLVVARRK